MSSQLKNQIGSLQTVLVLLLVVVGMNGLTQTVQEDSESLTYEITEGKIQAGEQIFEDSLIPNYLKAQRDFQKMNAEFDELAGLSEAKSETLPQLSLMSQTLYVFDQELKSTLFHTLNLEQRKEFLSRLEQIKKEFYSVLTVLRAEASESIR